MAKTIYLHIGTEKTGTTSIQKFLLQNTQLLEKNNIIYPRCVMKNTKISMYAQNTESIIRNFDLNVHLGIHDEVTLNNYRMKFESDFYKELSSISENDKIIISNEHCSSRLIYPNEIERIYKLLIKYTDDIKIIIYLRRQDEYRFSSYSTAVKGGAKSFRDKICVPKKEYNKPYGYRSLDYLSLINAWEEFFGKDSIIVKRYSIDRFKEKSLIVDFLETIGFNDFEEDKKIMEYNSSLEIDQLEFLRRMNFFLPVLKNNKLNSSRGNLVRCLGRIEQTGGSLLSLLIEDSNKINHEFKESNSQVAMKYLNENELFEYNDYKSNSKEILSASSIVTVNHDLFFERINEEESYKDLLLKSFNIFSNIWIEEQRIITKLKIKNRKLIKKNNRLSKTSKYDLVIRKLKTFMKKLWTIYYTKH